MSKDGAVAFYARVSSEAQTRDHTIDSQVAALKERIAFGLCRIPNWAEPTVVL